MANQRHHHGANGCPHQRFHQRRHCQYLLRRHLPSEPVSTATDDCGINHLVGCINPAAFTIANLYPATPGAYAYGSAGRNLIYGPGISTVNVSLFKNFPIKERLRFQFRFELFNALNHANFSNPASTFGTSSFRQSFQHVDQRA